MARSWDKDWERLNEFLDMEEGSFDFPEFAANVLPYWMGRVRKLEEALQRIIKNDNSYYDHHQARPDGKTPREVDGGTKFLTPREIAIQALGGER